MTIFQKLSWLVQMGVHHLCDEEAHPLVEESFSVSDNKKLSSIKSSLSATATHALEGVAAVPAKVVCVLEMPSASEDRTGVVLSGPEGELLEKMLKAIQLDVHQQAYVTYLSPWRSPGARVLTNIEINEGMELLKDRLKKLCPQVIIAFGMPVVRAMTGMTLGQVRTKKADYKGIPLFATFPPAFLIKNPDYKRQAWADLQKVQSFLQKAE